MLRISVFAVTASTLALSAPVRAQQAEPGTGTTGDNTIIVTALKREQSITDVPAGISVLGGQELEERGIESVQDLSFAVPGLTMREDGPGSYTIFLRGLANQSGSGTLVGLYLDEAPLSLSGYDQLSPSSLDIARVEVLKGPQGTLYGQGSAGGTIRYITARPDLSAVGGSVSGEVYGVRSGDVGIKATGVINLPLVTDTLGLRIAASYEDGGGWIDQPEAGIEDGNGTELLVLRTRLRWQPTEALTADAMVQIHRADTRLGLGYEQEDRTVDIGPDPSKELLPKEFDFNIYNLELNYDFGFANLVSSTSYADHDHQYPFTYIPRVGNYSYGYVEGNDDRFVTADQFSTELRLSSSDGPFDWTVGGYYSDGERELLAIYEYAYAPAGDLYSGGGVLYDGLYYRSASTSETYALFADAAYEFFGRLTLGAGIRYFHDDQTSLIEYAPATGSEQRATFTSTDPRFYASFRYAEDASLYASYGEGFRSGGFNSAPFDPYEPEDIKSYELGTRGTIAGGLLRFDVALFHTDYSDMIRRRLVNVNGQFLSESSNIGKVEVDGVEFGLQLEPVTGLTLGANGSYLDSEITDTDPGDQVNIAGDPTDYVPKWAYTLTANHAFPVGASAEGFVRIDYNHRDKVTYIDRSSFFPTALPQESDELDLLNVRIGVDFGQLGVELFGYNLTNQNASIDPYQGWANANRTRPRTLGIKAAYGF